MKVFDEVFIDCTAGSKKIKKNEYSTYGEIPVVDQGQDFIAGYTNQHIHKANVALPIVIFGDHTRIFKYIDFPFAVGADGVKILVPKNNYNAKFLYYQCLLHNIENNGYSRHFKFLKKKEFFIPPLSEQKRIADILDKADNLRKLRRTTIEKLNSLSQSIFYEMFGDISAKSQWAFPVVNLAEVCQKITDGTHQSPQWSDDGVPFIFVSNVKQQKISLETKKYVSFSEYKKLTKTTPVEYGDVLYTCVGSYGNTAVVDFQEQFIFQRHIAHLKPNKQKILPYYLSMCLETDILKRQADKVATGIAQKTVTLTGLKQFKIPLPPIELQNEYERKIKSIDALLNTQKQSLEELDKLFLSLQQRAFKGEL